MLQGAALTRFLNDDWGKQSKLFPAAIEASQYAVTAEEMLQLAFRDDVESRVVTPELDVVFGPFEEGPLSDGDFLMVQCLEQHLSTIARLIDTEFSFLPRWQIDDVMATLGSDGTHCGPHFDHYDVFLLQVQGRKTWQLDSGGHTAEELDEHADLRLLRRFEPDQTLTTKPGDVLYVPPGIGHHGISDGQSFTLSIGIRCPTTTELLAEISEFALESADATNFNHSIQRQGTKTNAAEIASALPGLLNRDVVDRWYGCYVTRLRNPDVLAAQEVPGHIDGACSATLASRFAWTQSGEKIYLFVNGECYPVEPQDKDWVITLTEERQLLANPDNPNQQRLFAELIASGALTTIA